MGRWFRTINQKAIVTISMTTNLVFRLMETTAMLLLVQATLVKPITR